MTTQTERAYSLLRDEIVRWELEPGQPIAEVEAAMRLGVSRTPVREALRRLSSEHLVRIIPGRGAFVTSLSIPDVVELFQMREALECYAVRLASRADNRHDRLPDLSSELAATRRDVSAGMSAEYYRVSHEIDHEIGRLIDNHRLQKALQDTWIQIARARHLASRTSGRLLESIDERLELVDAIVEGDGASAERLVSVHVHNSLQNILTSGRRLESEVLIQEPSDGVV